MALNMNNDDLIVPFARKKSHSVSVLFYDNVTNSRNSFFLTWPHPYSLYSRRMYIASFIRIAFLLFDHRLFAFIFLLKLSQQLTALRLSLSVDICTVCTKFPGRLKINILFQKC